MKAWDIVKLGELLTESKIESTNPDATRRIRVKLNVGGIEKRPDTNDKEGATKYYIRKSGQFIYGRQNLHKGAFGIIPKELDGFESSADIPSFDVNDRCYSEWIYYFFKQGDFYLKLESLAKGVGSKRIHPNQLFELNIPLPSKHEQKKILESIAFFEKNQSELRNEILNEIRLTEKLKSTVLIEAFQGKLTKDWRAKNPGVEDAYKLLEKIKNERELLVKRKEVKKDIPLPIINKNEIADELPTGWALCRFGQYAYCERGRFSARPRNDPKYYNGEIPFIQIGDLSSDGGPVTTHKQSLNDLGLKVSKLFPAQTVVIAIVGATIGNTGILDYSMCFPDSLVGIKPNKNTNSDFIEFFLRSKKEYFRNLSYAGGGQPNIKLPIINECLLMLPPLEEQSIIVEKIREIINLSNSVLKSVNQQLKDLDLINTSLLHDIFGERNPGLDRIQSTDDVYMLNLESNEPNYVKNLLIMELEQLLKEHGKMSASNLWKMSKFENDIDAFYEELKRLVEVKKTIKESKEKGFLELVK